MKQCCKKQREKMDIKLFGLLININHSCSSSRKKLKNMIVHSNLEKEKPITRTKKQEKET